jgi:hypothetical protein
MGICFDALQGLNPANSLLGGASYHFGSNFQSWLDQTFYLIGKEVQFKHSSQNIHTLNLRKMVNLFFVEKVGIEFSFNSGEY